MYGFAAKNVFSFLIRVIYLSDIISLIEFVIR